jgi:hypothetical protein
MALHFTKTTLKAYFDSDYILMPEDLKLHIGRIHPTAEEILLHQNEVNTYAWITACNPKSIPLGDQENEDRMRQLKKLLRNEILFEGLSQDKNGEWSETGLWVCNLGINDLRNIGRKFDQNAFTYAIIGHCLKLIII